MSTASQLIMNGIISGGIYALIAIGFTLIYGILKIIHFAHGEVFMIGAYIGWLFYSVLGVNIVLSFILAMLACGIIGVIIEKLFYKPLRKKAPLNSLIVALSLSLFLQAIIILVFGAQLKSFKMGSADYIIKIFGASITPLQATVILISILLMIILILFIKYTKTGKAVRASTDNLEVASVVGINTANVISIVFFIGSMLAGAAGVLFGIEHSITSTIGIAIIIKAFAASIVGGVGKIHGALVGGFIIGIVENVGIWFIPSGYKDAIAFVILILMLIFYPNGIFGEKVEEEIRQ